MASYPQFDAVGALDHRHAVGGAIVGFPRPVRAHHGTSPDHEGSTEPRRPVRVLVVDDDSAVGNMVATYLTDYDIGVTLTLGDPTAVTQLAKSQPSLIILDLGVDQESGLNLLRQIRSRSDVPVITTGYGCSETDRVAALELGADDHIAKPFCPRELLARMRAILRRWRESGRPGSPRHERDHYRFGGWQLDQRTRRLTSVSGERFPLTKGEYTLLVAFLNAPLRPLTREHLLQATRVHQDTSDRSIDVQVLRLRRKLEIDPGAPRVIRAERGVGYVFDLAVERSEQAVQIAQRNAGTSRSDDESAGCKAPDLPDRRNVSFPVTRRLTTPST